MASDEIRVRAVVRGRVQAVGFRDFAMRHARTAGLRGTVRNLSDGTVECVLQGPRHAVDGVVQRLHEGPRLARVDGVDVEDLQPVADLPAMTVTA
jgi:acylphosphatase